MVLSAPKADDFQPINAAVEQAAEKATLEVLLSEAKNFSSWNARN
jgi:hypothetical protein